ncbi:MAG: hypothetical protein ACRDQG_12165, partial [Pseudonocardiaceae bacterium]
QRRAELAASEIAPVEPVKQLGTQWIEAEDDGVGAGVLEGEFVAGDEHDPDDALDEARAAEAGEA